MMRFRALIRSLVVFLLLASVFSVFPAPSSSVKAQEVSKMVVFDLDEYSSATNRADWYDLTLFVGTLQGIVNQAGPKLYIRDYQHGVPIMGITNAEMASIGDYWFEKFRQPGQWLSEMTVIEISSVDELIAEFASELSGIVVWDPRIESTVNVATTIAGIERAPIVMAGGSLYHKMTSAPYNMPVVIDLNGQFTGANSKTDAYMWAKTAYLDTGRANAGVLSYVEDGFIRHPGTGGAQNYAIARDYAVKNKGFVFDLSPWGTGKPNDALNETLGRDKATLEAILQSAYNNYGVEWPIEVFGFFPWWGKYSDLHGEAHDPVAGEWEMIKLFSQYNAHLSSIMDTIGYSNASFHSWAPIGIGLSGAKEAPARPTLANKTYILYYMGDHDGGTIHQLMPMMWEDKRRGSIPLAWGIVPNMMRDYPDVAQYLYDTATPNDYFVAGASGAGYLDPGLVPNLEKWTQWNELLFGRTGYTMNGFLLNGSAGAISNTVEQAYARFSGDGLAGYPDSIAGTTPAVRNGNMIVVENTLGTTSNYNVDAAANQIVAAAASMPNIGNQPNFIHVRSSFAFPRFIEAVHKRIQELQSGYNFEAIDPFSYFSLARQSVSPQADDGIVLAVDTPKKMVAGQTYDVEIKVRNIGSNTWSPEGFYRLSDTANNDFIWSNLNGGYSLGLGNQRVFLSPGDSIAPQATTTFKFSVTAPSTAGTYTLAHRLVRDGVAFLGAEFAQPIEVVNATGNQAIITSVSVPEVMTEGTTETVAVTVKNVGNTTWTRANSYRLGTFREGLPHKYWMANRVDWTNFENGGASGLDSTYRAYLSDTDSIAPGQSKTFNFSVQAPSKRGSFVFSGRMVRDGVEYFGPAFEKEIQVVPSGRSGFAFTLIGSTVPQYMKAGAKQLVSISLKNTGTQAWTAGANYRLGAASGNQFEFSDFQNGGSSAGIANQRAYLRAGDAIAEEKATTFTFALNAPSAPGTYTVAVDMVHDGVAWAGHPLAFQIQVADTDDSSILSHNVPNTMNAGAGYSIRVEALNEGVNEWKKSSLYRLATLTNNDFKIVNSRDGGEGTAANNQRVYLNGEDVMGIGQRKQFDFTIVAPSTPGSYMLELRMVHDGVAFFGDTLTIPITVTTGYSQRVNVGGGAYTDSNGNAWSADAAYSSSTGWGYVGTTTTDSTTAAIVSRDSSSALDVQTFKTARKGSEFAYQFDVANGKYRVTLGFAELVKTAQDERLFRVEAEGQHLISGYDMFKILRGRFFSFPYSFEVAVTDGQLNLNFAGQVDQASVNAIWVERIQ